MSAFEPVLARSSPAVAALATELVAALARIAPDMEARVRTGWGSMNFTHKRAGFVCAVFPMAAHVDLVFEHGRLLDNSSGLLEGDGKQVRYVRLRPGMSVPEGEIAALVAEAIALRG
jgi:hypothetical protein